MLLGRLQYLKPQPGELANRVNVVVFKLTRFIPVGRVRDIIKGGLVPEAY